MGSKTNAIDRQACADAVDACACFSFAKAARSVTQLFNATLQPSGLRSTQFVALAVIHAEEPVGMARLAQAIVVDRSTLTRNLKPLQVAGLVAVTRPKGRRGNVVRLTAKGRRRLTEAVPLWEKAQTEFVNNIGPARWRTLKKDLAAAVDGAHHR